MFKPLAAGVQLGLDRLAGAQHGFARGDVMAGRKHRVAAHALAGLPGERVEQLQGFHFVVKQTHPQRQLGRFGRKDVDHIAAHAEHPALEFHVIAVILHQCQPADDVALRLGFAFFQVQDHLMVGAGVANAVNGRHGGDNHAIRPFQNRLGGRQPHLLDVFVDRRVFFNKQIPAGHVSLWLVVVVVRDKILDGVFRKKLAHFGIQLRGQGFVGRHDDGRPPGAGDHIGHGIGFA